MKMKMSKHVLLPLCAGLALTQQVTADNLRIVGGDKAMLSQYPFIAGLVNTGDDATTVFCGASVINANWILTAAHCVEDERAARLDVLLNTDNLQSTDSAERIRVSRIIMHPNYNSRTSDNDIALLKLSQPTRVKPIRVATPADALLEQTNQSVSVAGWGNRSTTGNSFPSQLHSVNLSVTDFNRCDRAYDNSLNAGQICAGTPQGGKDSCQGDSGGPLIARTTSGPVQLGVVSFGQDCGDADFPGVYARVSHFGDFLERAAITPAVQPDNPAEPEDPTTPVAVVTPPQNAAPAVPQDSVDSAEPDSTAPPIAATPVAAAPIAATLATATTPGYLKRVKLKRIDSFRRVDVGETGYALLEVFNPTRKRITVSDIAIGFRPDTPANGALSVDYEDCTYAPLQHRESCFIDVAWTPSTQGRLKSLITVNVSHNGYTKQLQKGAGGNAKSMRGFGDAIDFPWAQFDSDNVHPWQRSTDTAATGDSAIETDINADEPFYLSGDFTNEQPSTLSFQYSLTGATAIIEVNGEPLYELATTDTEWADAQLALPAQARVTWKFKPVTVSNATEPTAGKVKLDDFRLQATDSALTLGVNDHDSADSIIAVASSVGGSALGGSAGGAMALWPLLALSVITGLKTRARRRSHITHEHSR